MNCYERFARRVRTRPDVPAVVDPDGSALTYADLESRAAAVAAWLDDHTDPGDRVAVYMLDNPTVVAVTLGAWRAGRAVTPVNYRFGRDEVVHVLEDVQPGAVIHDAVYATSAGEAVAAADLDVPVVQGHAGGFEASAFGDPADAPDPATRLDDDVAIVMHTSGTTGDPKGVVQTHRNVSAQVDAGVAAFDVTADDVAVVSVPLFHVGGLHGATLMGLFTGGRIAIQPAWDAGEWARLVEATGATVTGLVPAMMVDALGTDAARERDTSSLRLCFYGGSPATAATLEAFRDAFDVADLRNYYGQTEAAGLTIAGTPETPLAEGALGRPVACVEARVVDPDTGADVLHGEQGELWLRGDSITPGYWNAPERTERAFEGEWFRSGDLVSRDDDGVCYYVDRWDDVVLSGGEKVAPTTVENALAEHEAVAAVVADGDLTAETVEAYCDDHPGLAGYEKPRRIHLVEALPRTGSQKVDKVALTERFADA